jgi:O-antigen/teichoic acid export membrane protein
MATVASSIQRLRLFAERTRWEYLALSIGARAVSALATLVIVGRVSATSFGGFSYLQATGALIVSLFALGIESSLNAAVRRRAVASEPIMPTIFAGIIVALAGFACSVATLILFCQGVADAHDLVAVGTLSLCIFSFVFIASSLLNGLSYGIGHYTFAAAGGAIQTGLFLLGSFVISSTASAWGLLYLFVAARLAGIIVQASCLGAASGRSALSKAVREHAVAKQTLREAYELGSYGFRQSIGVATLMLGYWFLQHELIESEQGELANAVYGVGNQIYNIIVFLPFIFNPLIVGRLSNLQGDRAALRRECIKFASLFLASSIAICIAVWITFAFALHLLPPAYLGSLQVVVVASAAAALQLVKAPFTLFFVAKLRAGPELIATSVGTAALLVGGFVFPIHDAETAMNVRFASQLLMTLCVAIAFLIANNFPRRQALHA